ncbi:MAG TPA: DNA-directed RNA polymerase subunit beta, partial [Polyangia bacterium]|nr:DNA-directed RNA polymerase subunit beta [Polyangia bacterium]
MASPVIQNNFRARKTFAKIAKIIDIPNLIDIQKQSYEKFLQKDVPLDKREDVGLQGVFKSVFPIKDFSETSSLEFVSYTLDKPKYDVDECRQRGMTFAAPIKVIVRLVVWDTNEETGSQSIRDVKEQEVFFGEIPLMTDNGTFIINGTERVVVSQLHRSPGVFYDHDKGKTHSSGKLLYSARIIPYRGSWLDFEFDPKDNLFVRIDRRRKLPATILLRALGYNNEQILDIFFEKNVFHLDKKEGAKLELVAERLRGETLNFDLRAGNEVIVEAGKRVTARHVRALQHAKIKNLEVPDEYLIGRIIAHDIVDKKTGELLAAANSEIDQTHLEAFRKAGVDQIGTLFVNDL